jgi:predicted aspartyl protease
MFDEMGTFRIDVELENVAARGRRAVIAAALVDTGAGLSWFPQDVLDSLDIERAALRSFRQADGSILQRWVGPAFVHVAGVRTTDDVVFAQAGDLTILGARSLEGLNLRVDPASKRLVDAGPAPAAVAA